MSPLTPLVDPSGYFDDRSNPLPRGALIFGLYALTQVLFVYSVMQLLLEQIDGLDAGLRSQLSSQLTLVVLFGLVGVVIAWLVVAGVMHVLAGSGTGTFGDALGVAGWAYVPEIVTLPLSYYFARSEIESYSFDGSDPQRLVEQLQAAEAEMQLTGTSVLLLLLVTGWSVYILADGVSSTHDVPVRKAALPAVLVGIGSLLFTLFSV